MGTFRYGCIYVASALKEEYHVDLNGIHVDVSENSGFSTPNHPILIKFSIINHPFWGFSPYFWKHPCR